jgi:hypothetical protein
MRGLWAPRPMYNLSSMRDDEIDDLPEELSPDDPAEFLEQLDSTFAEVGLLEDLPLTGTVLSRQEVDDLIDRTVTEELARLSGPSPK